VLRDKLMILQKEMELKLQKIQVEHIHRGNRGDNSEEIVREFLREFLPLHNRIGQGEIIDTQNNISRETDIVILNEYHPYLNDLSKPSLFFIEGVGAAGEVKSNLNSSDITTTLDKCFAFKNMHIKMQVGAQAYGNLSDLNRFVSKRPFFLIAFKSQITLDTIYQKIVQYNLEKNIPIEHQIDGVFMLDRGTIFNLGDGEGMLKFGPVGEGEKSAKGFLPIHKEDNPMILLNLLIFLSTSMLSLNLNRPIIQDYLIPSHPNN